MFQRNFNIFWLQLTRLTVYNYIIKMSKGRESTMLEYISSPEAAKKWCISERRVQKPCEGNRIPDVAKFSRM